MPITFKLEKFTVPNIPVTMDYHIKYFRSDTGENCGSALESHWDPSLGRYVQSYVSGPPYCWNQPDLFLYSSTTSQSVACITYIEYKNSINSPVQPAGKVQWAVEFSKSQRALNRRRPRLPLCKPPVFKKLRRPVLKLLTKSDMPIRQPSNGRPWKPKKLRSLTVKRDARLAAVNRIRVMKYNRRLKQIDLIEAKRRQRIRNYLKNFSIYHEKVRKSIERWDVAEAKALKAFVKKRRNAKSYALTENPYSRMKLFSTNGGGNCNLSRAWDAAYPTHPEYWLMWGVNWHVKKYNYMPLSFITTEEQQRTAVEDTYKALKELLRESIEPIDIKARRKIPGKFQNQKVHIGNLLAERHQSLQLLSTSLKRITELVKLKKSVLKNTLMFIKNPKLIASEILAFKFGVEPLVADYNAAVKFLSEDEDKTIVTVRSKSSGALSFQKNGCSFSGIITVSYVVKTQLDNELFVKLNEWGLANPLEVAWEVLPWSFVIDWLYPVGTLISSLSATQGLTFKSCTRHVKCVGNFSMVAFDPPYTKYGANASCLGGDWTGTLEFRDVLPDYPEVPVFEMKSPFSATHSLEAICLLIQKLK